MEDLYLLHRSYDPAKNKVVNFPIKELRTMRVYYFERQRRHQQQKQI